MHNKLDNTTTKPVILIVTLILISIFQLLETCSDKIKNQDEEDVDCGGSACSPCALVNSKFIYFSIATN